MKTDSTSLKPLTLLLANYDTEYHYLFSIVFSAHKNQASDFCLLLPNATRKLLEMFTAFAEPTKTNFADALLGSDVKVSSISKKALERLVQIESHGTMIGMSALPALTIEESIKASSAAMEFIRKRDNKHFKAMKSCVTKL